MIRHQAGYLLLLAVIGFCQIQKIVSIEETAKAATVWPCPTEEDFSPCVCTTDDNFLLNADCSGVKTDLELATAFSKRFSLYTFNKLVIDHSECNDCQLTILNQTTFGPISFVDVDIQNTGITIIGESAFANSQHTLQSLILSHNQISSFTFQAIGEFQILEVLNLQSNKFDAATPIPDIESSSLKRLILSANPGLSFTPTLVTGCPLLTNLYLKSCDIDAVPMNVIDVEGMVYGLEYINHINLASNAITQLGTASVSQGGGMATLGEVDFSDNNIDTVTKNFVSGFGSSGKLIMANNNIKELFQDVWQSVFEELAALGTDTGLIDLQGNPLLCGCDIAWLFGEDSTLLSMIQPDTTCSDQITTVVDLPPTIFDQCPVKMGKIK